MQLICFQVVSFIDYNILVYFTEKGNESTPEKGNDITA